MDHNTPKRLGERIGYKRIPVPVIVIACLYLTVGIGGFVLHFGDLRTPDGAWVGVTELLAIVCGAFLLRGQNWARWLAAGWMAFHVIISFGVLRQFAIHSLFFVSIVWYLFRGDASCFFKNATME